MTSNQPRCQQEGDGTLTSIFSQDSDRGAVNEKTKVPQEQKYPKSSFHSLSCRRTDRKICIAQGWKLHSVSEFYEGKNRGGRGVAADYRTGSVSFQSLRIYFGTQLSQHTITGENGILSPPVKWLVRRCSSLKGGDREPCAFNSRAACTPSQVNRSLDEQLEHRSTTT